MFELITAFIITTFFAVLFLLVSESFGLLGIKFTAFILNKFGLKESFEYSNSFSILNVFVGLLFYGMSLFFIGLLHLLYPVVILSLSALVFLFTFILYRRHKNIWSDFKQSWAENKWIYLGTFICFLLLANSIYRPAVQFDAVWYHLPIPKYFLQNNNIDYSGFHWRYSVHPYLNFFWSLPPLALGFSTLKASLIINITQGFLVLLSVFKVSSFLKNKFKPVFIIQTLIPFLIGISFSTVFWLGAGYNDLYAFAESLILFVYINSLKKINLLSFLIAIYLVIIISLLKIFFAFFGTFVVVYLCYLYIFENSHKLPSKEILIKKSKHIIIIGLINFVIFVLPWLVRSYLWTGRILDPIGVPGMNEDAYNFAGSGDRFNHWTSFVIERLNKNIPRIFIDSFSPLFGLGVISILHSKVRKNFMDWWVLAFSGFWFVFFVSIVQQNRYYFPQVAILTVLGCIFLLYVYQDLKSVFSKTLMWVPIVILVFLVGLRAYSTDNFLAKTYFSDIRISAQPAYLEATLDRNLKRNKFQYFQSNPEYLPKNLNQDDMIMIYGIHSSGYIENPIFEYRTNPGEFFDLDNFDEFYDLLIDKNVKFMVIREEVLDRFCKSLNIEESQCLDNDKITEDVFDSENKVQWYKVNR